MNPYTQITLNGIRMKFEIIPVDLENNLATCISFRKDAYFCSYGSYEGFSENKTIAWFKHLSNKNSLGFLHIWLKDKIVGQLEFQSGIETEDGKRSGYINLFYLRLAMRGSGLGKIAHEFVIEKLAQDGCQKAMLYVIPGNKRAEAFYLKNGWYKSQETESNRGQLMYLDIHN